MGKKKKKTVQGGTAQDWFELGYNLGCEMYEDRFDEDLADMDDAALEDRGLVRLPVDVAGETWRIGDESTCGEVKNMTVSGTGWLLYTESGTILPESSGHVVSDERPTLSSMLRETAAEMRRTDGFAECAGGITDAPDEILAVADMLEKEGM